MKLIRIILAGAVFAAALPVQAQFAKSEDAIKYRKAALTVLANHFSRIGAVTKGAPYNKEEVIANATLIETVSKLPWEAFVAGSDAGDTKAKPEIWSDAAKFKQTAEKLQAETAKLTIAAKSGNLEQIKAAFGAVGQTCKSCHDNFKNK